MKQRIVLLLMTLLMTIPLMLPAAAEGELAARVATSQAAVQQLASSLQGELMTAMQSGGPSAAIDVCHRRAVAIADEVATESGLMIGRTSLKLRNPANAPDEWERNVLQQFDSQRAAGASAADLTYYEVVTEGDEKWFRFMRAIPTGGVCLTCHGDTVPSDIQHALERWYPDDQATGYSEGEVRGAFTVLQRM